MEGEGKDFRVLPRPHPCPKILGFCYFFSLFCRTHSRLRVEREFLVGLWTNTSLGGCRHGTLPDDHTSPWVPLTRPSSVTESLSVPRILQCDSVYHGGHSYHICHVYPRPHLPSRPSDPRIIVPWLRNPTLQLGLLGVFEGGDPLHPGLSLRTFFPSTLRQHPWGP